MYTVGDRVRILAPILSADRTREVFPVGHLGTIESVPDRHLGIYGITLDPVPALNGFDPGPAGYQAHEIEHDGCEDCTASWDGCSDHRDPDAEPDAAERWGAPWSPVD